MAFNNITGISVGADLSRTSPIYRPRSFNNTPLSLLRLILLKQRASCSQHLHMIQPLTNIMRSLWSIKQHWDHCDLLTL